MSKKKKIAPLVAELKREIPILVPGLNLSGMMAVIAVLSAIFYFNTIFNKYALDDGIVIINNPYTQMGFAGLKGIFTHDSFSTVEGVAGELTGGRYRPLSVATFAMEVGLFGKSHPMMSHLINVLIYSSICLLLLLFMARYLFPGRSQLAFLAVLLFTIHPLHTEVIANIKSRDELLSLLFLMVSLVLYFEHRMKNRNYVWYVGSLFAFFLSLLSKETGITFIVLIPLMLYLFGKKKINESVLSAIPFAAVAMIYILIRIKIVGLPVSQSREVMNSPFLYASALEKFGTKVSVMGKYLVMLLFPHPLSYDYSYNQIPYVSVTDFRFILSFILNGCILAYAFFKIHSKPILAFAILFYYITFSVVSNFVFDVGSPMNERFLFQPSIGFSIAAALFLEWMLTMEKLGTAPKRVTMVLALLVLVILCAAFKTISRNAQWKDDPTLFIADAENAPNSAKTNGHCGVSYINLAGEAKDEKKRQEYFELALVKLRKAIEIYPRYADPYMNMAAVLSQQDKLEEAKEALRKAQELFPTSSVLKINLQYLAQKYVERGQKQFYEKNLNGAIASTLQSLDCNPQSVSAWYNLGGYYLTMQEVTKAKEAWSKALLLDPTNKEIQQWMTNISQAPPNQNKH